MKTIKDGKGNAYTIGAIYDASHDGVKWFASILAHPDDLKYWTHIRECQAPVGKIEKSNWWDGIRADDVSTWVWCGKKWRRDNTKLIYLAASARDGSLLTVNDGNYSSAADVTPLTNEQCDQLDAITGLKTARVNYE